MTTPKMKDDIEAIRSRWVTDRDLDTTYGAQNRDRAFSDFETLFDALDRLHDAYHKVVERSDEATLPVLRELLCRAEVTLLAIDEVAAKMPGTPVDQVGARTIRVLVKTYTESPITDVQRQLFSLRSLTTLAESLNSNGFERLMESFSALLMTLAQDAEKGPGVAPEASS